MRKLMLIIPGWCSPNREWNLSVMPDEFRRSGYDVARFKAMSGGRCNIRHNGDYLAGMIAKAHQDYDYIHLVGHSMGGLLARYCDNKFDLSGRNPIQSITTLATPHYGTLTAHLGAFASHSARQMVPHSHFLDELNDVKTPTPVFSVTSTRDEVIMPNYHSEYLYAKHSVRVEDTHVSLLWNKQLASQIVDFAYAAESAV